MFGVSWGEVLLAALVAFLVLGPGKLPEAARTAGQVYGRLHRLLAEARAALQTDLAALSRPGPARPSPPAAPAAPPPAEDPDRRG